MDLVRDEAHDELAVRGEFTLNEAQEMRDALLTALSGSDRVAIRLDDVVAFDIAALQILCAARRSAASRRKSLTLASPPPESLRAAAVAAGLNNHGGCPLDCGGDCLWKAA